VWTDPESGEGVETCTIITTAANEAVRKLHDRMPVEMRHKAGEKRLNTQPTGKELLVLFDSEAMTIEAG